MNREIKNILLIFPSMKADARFGTNVKDFAVTAPPLGLLYIGAILKKHGYACQIVDPNALGLESDEKIPEYLGNISPDFIGIYTNTANLKKVLELSKYLKDIYGVPICLGGPHATIAPEKLLENHWIDFIVIGEGERTVVELLKILNNSGSLSKVAGLAYKEGKQVIVNPQGKFLSDLDQIPFPAREMVPISNYNPGLFEIEGSATSMMTSRGCPFGCTFCASRNTWGRQYRLRSVENVIAEIEHVISNYGIRNIVFWDDLFGLDHDWVKSFCQMILDKKIELIWQAEVRVDTIDIETLKIMKKAGCYSLFFGAESFDQETLDSIEKKVKVQDISNTIEMVKKVGIQTVANFVIGFPKDTPEKALKTLKLVKQINPDYAKFNLFTPYPGTVVYNELKSGKWGGKINEDWENYTSYFPVFLPEGYKNYEELKKIQQYAIKSFYMRPSYIWSQIKKIKNTRDIKRLIKGFSVIKGL